MASALGVKASSRVYSYLAPTTNLYQAQRTAMRIRSPLLFLIAFWFLSVLMSPDLVSQDNGHRNERQHEKGAFFQKRSYTPSPLPKFEQLKAQLPSPIFDEKPLWTKLYWKAWELASRNFHEPAPGSGFVSQFIDAAFNDNIFLWDTAFMTMFCNVASPLVPGIVSLDNFYIKQHSTGEICREIQRKSGLDFIYWANTEDKPLFSRWGWVFPPAVEVPVVYKDRPAPSPNPRLTLDALNHPILAWAELESYRTTGDSSRLRLVWRPLLQYYRALQTYLRQGNGLYITDWASMDNSPRNPYLMHGGTGIDISAEMVLFARNLAQISRLVGKNDDANTLMEEAAELSTKVNKLMWDDEKKFYFDLTIEGKKTPVRTVAAFWTLLAQVASSEQAKHLVAELQNPKTFWRMHPVPTCAADEAGYYSNGGYWRGAVWAPTNTMVIRGLEQYGYSDLARTIALKHLQTMTDVYGRTGTIWENYAPDSSEPGRNTDGKLVMKDFVGWSGIGPILYFLEYGIGLRPDAPKNELEWRLESKHRTGCERYRFNGHVVSLQAEPASNGSAREITVESTGAFNLRVTRSGVQRIFSVKSGKNRFSF